MEDYFFLVYDNEQIDIVFDLSVFVIFFDDKVVKFLFYENDIKC